MGSVRDLYTTGDNDPEIQPAQRYRHYLYCNACGSFDLTSWEKADSEAIGRMRGKLGAAALYLSPLAAVPAWGIMGFVLSLSFFLTLATGIALTLILWGFLLFRSNEPFGALWRAFKIALLWLLIVGAVELLSEDLPQWPAFAFGVIVVSALLAWRGHLGSKVQSLGKRCNECEATYAYGSDLFTDLEANPRNLTINDVPRPLGVSPFEQGEYVGEAPVETTNRLP
jgi:hypothetical protein